MVLMFNDSSISIRKSYYLKHTSVLFSVYGNQDNILFYLSLMTANKVAFVPQVLTYYRVHAGATSYESDLKKYCGLLHNRIISLKTFLNYITTQGFSDNVVNLTYSDIMSQTYQYMILKCSCTACRVFPLVEKCNRKTFKMLYTKTRFFLFILYIISKIMPRIMREILWLIVKKK